LPVLLENSSTTLGMETDTGMRMVDGHLASPLSSWTRSDMLSFPVSYVITLMISRTYRCMLWYCLIMRSTQGFPASPACSPELICPSGRTPPTILHPAALDTDLENRNDTFTCTIYRADWSMIIQSIHFINVQKCVGFFKLGVLWNGLILRYSLFLTY